MELLRLYKASVRRLNLLIIRSFLMRIFAVAQFLHLFKGHSQIIRQLRSDLLSQIVGDHRVVSSRVLEHLQSQTVFGVIGNGFVFL